MLFHLQITQKPKWMYRENSKLSLFRFGVFYRTHNNITAKEKIEILRKVVAVMVNDILAGWLKKVNKGALVDEENIDGPVNHKFPENL